MGHIIAIPLGDFTPAERREMHVKAVNAFRTKAMELLNKTAENIAIRDAFPATPTDADVTDWRDIKVRTAQAVGQQYWAQDATDLTAGDLAAWLATDYVIPDKSVLGIYGFIDLSTVKDLTAIRYERGAEKLLVVQPEKCYGYPNEPDGGFFVDTDDPTGKTPALLIWQENDAVQIYHNCKAAADRFIVHYAIWAETKEKRAKGYVGLLNKTR